ncbi:T9SS type A sorting domain-containing protein [bacterium]|nr:T9SS type A sorting domain-containing protein [bacterium]
MGGWWRTLLVALLALSTQCLIFTDPSSATPPDILSTQTFDERGEFYSVVIAHTDTASPGTYLTGIALQNLFQAYAVKLNLNGETAWTRTWGTTNRMFDCLWRDGGGTMIGFTSENSTLDYKLVHFSGTGTLQNTWNFGGNQTSDRGFSAAYSGTGYLVVGQVTPGTFGDSDGSMVRLNQNGGVEWSQLYDSSSVVRRVAQVDSQTIWIYGTADSVAGAGRDFWMATANSTGEITAQFRFGGVRDEDLYDAVRVSEDLTLLVGWTRSFGDSARTNIWVVATNDFGDLIWQESFGGTENDAALCVRSVADRDSGFVVGGYWSEQHLGTRNAFLMKFDQDFDSVWTIVFNDTVNSSEFRDVALDASFRYHAAGIRSTPLPHGFYMKTDVDPSAPVQHSPLPFSLLLPDDGAFFTTDTMRFRWEATTDPDPGDQIAYALLFDTDTLFDDPFAVGPLQNPTHLLNRSDDIFDRYWRVVAQDQHGNLRVCSDRHRHVRKIRPDSTLAFNLLGPDSGSALTTPTGHFSWEAALDPDSADEVIFYCLFFQNEDSISLIDTIWGTSSNVTFTDHPFIQESDTVRWWVVANSRYPVMQRQSRQTWTFVNWNVSADPVPYVPAQFTFDRAYPNPFNTVVTLEYSLPQATNVNLSVFDITGRVVALLASGVEAPGSHTVRWDGTSDGAPVSTGVYFARLSADEFVATQKLLLLK